MGLIAHYKLDGDARDSVGSNHGTASNVTWVDGKLGNAGEFNGSDSGVIIEDFPQIFVGSVSLSFWAKFTDDSRGIIFGSYSQSPSINFEKHTSQRLRLYWNGGELNGYSTDYAFPIGEWFHGAIIRNVGKGRIEFWVNGELNSSTSGVGSPVPAAVSTFWVGRDTRTGSTVVAGLIDDVRIYDHALSPREVRDLSLGLVRHYSLGVNTYDTQGSGEATEEDAITHVGSHTVFDGSSGYFRIPRSEMRKEAATLSAHVFVKDFTSHDGRADTAMLCSYWGATTYGFIGFKSSGAVYFEPNANSEGGTFVSPHIAASRWFHFAAVFDNSVARFYVNGEQCGSVPISAGLSVDQFGHAMWSSVWMDGYPGWLDGYLRDVRLYATALTSSQVKELYQQRASIDSEGTVHVGVGEVISGTGPAGLQHVNVTARDGAYFNGHDSYAHYEDVAGDLQPSEISVSAWVYVVNPNSWRRILSIGDVVNNSDSWTNCAYLMWLSNSNLEVILNGSSYRSPKPSLPENTWVRIGFTYDGNRVKVFVGGNKVSDEAFSQTIDYSGRNIFQLGGHNRYSWYQGGIRDVAIVGRAVSEAEFLDGLGPETNGLISWLPMRDDTTTVNNRGRLGKPVSEVGITRGLVAWYPLIGDTLDYAGTSHAVNNGAVAAAEGYEFDGGEHLLAGFAPGESTLGQRFTWTWLDRPSRFASNTGSHGSAGSPRLYKQWENASGAMRVAVGDSFWTAIPSNNIPLGVWSFFAVVFEEGEVRTYLNGQLQDTTSGVVFSGENSNAFSVGRGLNGERHYEGVSRDHRIHNVALTPEEVAIQAKLALNQATKSAMTQSCLYTKNQFKEVIA